MSRIIEYMPESKEQASIYIQHVVVPILGICNFIGGAFGGKESVSCILSTAAAVASNKLVYATTKCVTECLIKDKDMQRRRRKHGATGV